MAGPPEAVPAQPVAGENPPNRRRRHPKDQSYTCRTQIALPMELDDPLFEFSRGLMRTMMRP
ncbi:MAG: hypothetical protein ACRDWS_09635, partial [Acidimicrobiia bacterium]